MKTRSCLIALCITALAPIPIDRMTAEDTVRVREFYRLASQVQNEIWPGWSETPAPLLLVTSTNEFLTHVERPPEGFANADDGFLVRPRKFSPNFQATFPAFGPPSVIVVGTPENTASKMSTPWLFMVMHEHFHQLQDGQPNFFKRVEELGLSHGDTSGMWMLNYPFPYEKPEIAASFAKMRDVLLVALAEPDDRKFRTLAAQYLRKRKAFFALLAPDDRKYFNFQLWKEGIARYAQVKASEAGARYEPTKEFAALPDYTPFAEYAKTFHVETLLELKKTDLAKSQRVAFYSFGAAEGFMLDRLNPGWKKQYFEHLFTLDECFAR